MRTVGNLSKTIKKKVLLHEHSNPIRKDSCPVHQTDASEYIYSSRIRTEPSAYSAIFHSEIRWCAPSLIYTCTVTCFLKWQHSAKTEIWGLGYVHGELTGGCDHRLGVHGKNILLLNVISLIHSQILIGLTLFAPCPPRWVYLHYCSIPNTTNTDIKILLKNTVSQDMSPIKQRRDPRDDPTMIYLKFSRS